MSQSNSLLLKNVRRVCFIFLINIFVLFNCRSIDITHELTNNTIAHLGHCFSSLIPEVGAMEEFEYKTVVGVCVWAICDSDTTIYYGGCGKWKVPPRCKLFSEDLSKAYPDCCPYVDCS